MNNQIVRNIQVDLILGNPNSIIEWFNGIWKDLSIIEESVCHNMGKEFIYFNNKKEWIFYRDDKSDIFWCHYERYWSVIKYEFSLDYNSIQELTKFLVEDALCNNIVITDIDFLTSSNIIENALTNSSSVSVATPCVGLRVIYENVDSALNNSVAITTPLYFDQYDDIPIKSILNDKDI